MRAALKNCNRTNLLFLAVTLMVSFHILLTVCDGPGKRHGW